MFNKDFKYCEPTLNYDIINQFDGNEKDKNLLRTMCSEWNDKVCVSVLSNNWRKVRLSSTSENLSILLWNCECLHTHTSDLDLLLSLYCPHVCILTGVGKQIRRLPYVPNYKWFSKEGNNSFGGVACLIQNEFTTTISDESENFLLLKIELGNENIYIGAVYIPPNHTPPLYLFDKHKENDIYIFGDFNAKHESWQCEKNNVSGNILKEWMEENGFEVLHPGNPTSKRSTAIIDLGIVKDTKKWSVTRLEEGTSDHYPIFFVSPFASNNQGIFRKTNWRAFSFFLYMIYPYWNSLVYNYDYNTFFNIFTEFLAAVRDRCSEYVTIKKFRPPWPPFFRDYYNFVEARRTYFEEKTKYKKGKIEDKIEKIKEGNNIWTYVKNKFRTYTPSFQGITVENKTVKDNQKIVSRLAEYYEKHFSKPIFNSKSPFHMECIEAYERIEKNVKIPMEKIKLEEVIEQWKGLKSKKSLDSTDTSAQLLKNLPQEYLYRITTLFNKCADEGEFFEREKIEKWICLSKEGAFPTEDRLRSISLLPNLSKIFEKIVAKRIEKWCKDQGVYVDEQSGFTANRRLQTRIVAMIEDLRLTIAAPNRPALTIFVDFLTAFDRMWYPALMRALERLDMPIELRKWIYNWLQNRKMFISHGDMKSKIFSISVGAPQGSVLAALLFRLHVFFLPSYFPEINCHLFADDLTMVIKGALEKKLSDNLIYIQNQAKIVLQSLEKFAYDHNLPVNTKKTKAMLIHSTVAVEKPDLFYKNVKIEYVKTYKFLGVEIGTKLGLGYGGFPAYSLEYPTGSGGRNVRPGQTKIVTTIYVSHVAFVASVFF
ncbi:unnamed protein product [Rotaria socialis]|uniref:Reverse transcriptase domain-containing protein n=1 Tax=Rotaria socialis TaxID=392032 RepID=A0A818B6C3_9BILA|nr:unnamed protein product [Rotaria socialis]